MNGYHYYRKRDYLSISSLVSFSRCPRKFFYEHCGLREPTEHPALLFGQAMHAALPITLIKGVDEGLSIFSKVWDSGKDDEDEKRNTRRAAAMLQDYYQQHRGTGDLYELLEPPDTGVTTDKEVSDYEFAFAIDIGLPLPLAGRIDALVRHKLNGSIWVLEFKTSSEISGRFLSGFELNPQFLGYCLVARESTEEQVPGVLLEALRVSKVNAETVLHPTFVTDNEINLFLQWARYYGNLLLACEQSEDFRCNLSMCTPYPAFGQAGYQCKYIDLCKAPKWTDMMDMFLIKEDPVIFKPKDKGNVD